jgi:hypothetical protein
MALCTRQSNYPVTFPAEFITVANAMPKLHLEIEPFSLKKSASLRGTMVIASTPTGERFWEFIVHCKAVVNNIERTVMSVGH